MTLFPNIDHQYLSQTVLYNMVLDTDVQNAHMKSLFRHCGFTAAAATLLTQCDGCTNPEAVRKCNARMPQIENLGAMFGGPFCFDSDLIRCQARAFVMART